MSEAENVITKLKARFQVETDSDLASRLFVSRSTVANWRNRDSVPSRYVRIAEGETNWSAFSRPPFEKSNIEVAAMRLAVLRLVRDFGDIATDYRAFLSRSGEAGASFNLYWATACKDLAKAMSDRDSDDAFNVAAILAYNEVFAKE